MWDNDKNDLEQLANDLWPLFRRKLMDELGPTLEAIAAEATETIGLEHVSLAAMIDYLQDHRLPDVGGLIERLAINDGDLIVISPRDGAILPPLTVKEISEAADRNITLPLKKIGRNVVVVVCGSGLDINQFTARKPT